MSVNKVILIGNLGADPQVHRTQDGRPIVTMSLATSDRWRDKATGERKERTEWHRVVVFNEGLCKIAEQYLKKGSRAYFEGALRTRKWTDQAGVEKYTTEVVLQFDAKIDLLDRAQSGPPRVDDPNAYGSGDDRDFGATGAGGNARRPAVAGAGKPDLDDEIPF